MKICPREAPLDSHGLRLTARLLRTTTFVVNASWQQTWAFLLDIHTEFPSGLWVFYYVHWEIVLVKTLAVSPWTVVHGLPPLFCSIVSNQSWKFRSNRLVSGIETTLTQLQTNAYIDCRIQLCVCSALLAIPEPNQPSSRKLLSLHIWAHLDTSVRTNVYAYHVTYHLLQCLLLCRQQKPWFDLVWLSNCTD